jgi:hypothetical protein
VNVPEPFVIGIILPVVVDLVCLSETKNKWLRCRNLICKEMWPVIVGRGWAKKAGERERKRKKNFSLISENK